MAKDKEERFDNILEFATVLKTIHLNTKPPAAKTSASPQTDEYYPQYADASHSLGCSHSEVIREEMN